MSITPLEALPLETLRRRSSTKWRTYPEDVLPLFVAEVDFALAPAITAVLAEAVANGDTGYTPPDPGIRAAFSRFAARRFGWTVDPARVRTTADVMMGVVELLRATTNPGDGVVIMPPVYPPFALCTAEAGCVSVPVPLRDTGTAWELDLAGIDAALEAGARAVLLCNPHNPTGTVHSAEALTALAEIAERHGAVVISDEIHAPLVSEGVSFTPFLTAGEAATRVGYAVTSASKAYNLAGLKCALMVTADEATTSVVRGLNPEVEWRTGLFGALAGVAAFDEASDAWLDALRAALAHNRALLTRLLAEKLPRAVYREPDAGFLAWIDVSAYGWGDDPATRLRRAAKVALHHGPEFGAQGVGYVRLNFGCSPEVLTEAVERIAAVARAEPRA
ncbi:MAG: aminotransferase class I/II-fold pyridoxal phosphate-dependent enzyme [Microbacterium sp.]|uniref:MalY/PatB family protein n=1 Tax=Microbacterium sp. TaxID=51671 RepID=UPI001AD529EB|nr:aminotransferase class I/II-fold pyridoxal phosphate-dependent enzyme [Microbacterium sp.]MBN9177349.1 aminotransferase class I/II-fold pyridoxal phosphate-dependent enzyme [Microbacterium sp.]